MHSWRWLVLTGLLSCLSVAPAHAQIDPVKRDLLQIGYNAALQGHQPLSAYFFWYHNRPEFLRTNLTLRLAIAPTYLDSELGISQALGENTDLGLGLAGGGFADSYAEVRGGFYRPRESFTGHGAELSTSIYHHFNPGAKIPLNGVLRVAGRFSTYVRDSDTAQDFQMPADRGTFSVRTGLRWGGREPTLFPSLAMELSVWYDGQFRTGPDYYGFGDRKVEDNTHVFWAEALLIYTLPDLNHTFQLSLTAGSSISPDRFSAYRLGALLPLVSEYPLTLPGYYYQELTAREFVLLSGNYLIPLDQRQRWNIDIMAATAAVDYLRGLEQSGHWHSGVGAGVLFRTAAWKFMVSYSYGIDAIRSDGRGAHSIGILAQLDWGQARQEIFNPTSPNLWQGVQRVFGLFGS
jgi:hypothetical protein